jgi:hypothetical protein
MRQLAGNKLFCLPCALEYERLLVCQARVYICTFHEGHTVEVQVAFDPFDPPR